MNFFNSASYDTIKQYKDIAQWADDCIEEQTYLSFKVAKLDLIQWKLKDLKKDL